MRPGLRCRHRETAGDHLAFYCQIVVAQPETGSSAYLPGRIGLDSATWRGPSLRTLHCGSGGVPGNTIPGSASSDDLDYATIARNLAR